MSRSRNILVLDDEAGIRTALCKVLELHGHRAFSAGSAEEALAIAGRDPVEIVLTDLRLEECDGVEAFERVRRLRPEAKLVVMTGFASLDSALRALRLGAVDYLTKPFRIEALLAAVAKASETGTGSARRLELPWRGEAETNSDSVAQLLHEIAALLRSLDLPKEIRTRAAGAFAEAVGNAARHAYRDAPGAIEVSLQEEDGILVARVSDRGVGFDAPATVAESLARGSSTPNGIWFLHRQADDLRIRSAKGKGCTVEFRIAGAPSAERVEEAPEERLLRQALWA